MMTARALAAMNVVDAMTSVPSACRAMILGIVLDSLQLQFYMDQFDPFATTFRLPLPIGQELQVILPTPSANHHQFIGLVWVTSNR